MSSEEKKKKFFLTRLFDSASKGLKQLSASSQQEAQEIKDEVKQEISDMRNDGADFIEKHGQGRIKMGTGSALKAGVFKVWAAAAARTAVAKTAAGASAAAKIGAATAPIAKFTVPLAFAAGFLFGPPVAKKAAEILRPNTANDNEPSDTPDNEADIANTPPSPKP